jgi:hypothetical protein
MVCLRIRRHYESVATRFALRADPGGATAPSSPTIDDIEALRHQRPHVTPTVILPELVVRHWRQRTARLRRALRPPPRS